MDRQTCAVVVSMSYNHFLFSGLGTHLVLPRGEAQPFENSYCEVKPFAQLLLHFIGVCSFLDLMWMLNALCYVAVVSMFDSRMLINNCCGSRSPTTVSPASLSLLPPPPTFTPFPY